MILSRNARMFNTRIAICVHTSTIVSLPQLKQKRKAGIIKVAPPSKQKLEKIKKRLSYGVSGQPIEDGGDARQLLADWRNDLDNIMNSKETAPPVYTKAPPVDLRRVTLTQTIGTSPERTSPDWNQDKQQPRHDKDLSATDKVLHLIPSKCPTHPIHQSMNTFNT